MVKSQASDNIQPTICQNLTDNAHTGKYLALPDNIADILIDACEQHFLGKGYNQEDVKKYCKYYLRVKGYIFKGSEPAIEQVSHYFHENRFELAQARAIYPGLKEQVGISRSDIGKLPGGVCNKVRYILAIEHYISHIESIAPGENQE